MSRLVDVVAEIERWAAEHAPASLVNLNAPASAREFAKLKFLLPADTPAEFYELLSIHDGEGWRKLESLFPDVTLMSAVDVVGVYSYCLQQSEETLSVSAAAMSEGRRAHGPVIATVNSPRRIPFATMDGKIYWQLDLIPAPGGQHGQVISEDVEDGTWKVLAPSLTSLFESYLAALQAGQLDIDSDGNIRNDRGLWLQGG